MEAEGEDGGSRQGAEVLPGRQERRMKWDVPVKRQ